MALFWQYSVYILGSNLTTGLLLLNSYKMIHSYVRILFKMMRYESILVFSFLTLAYLVLIT